MPVWVAARNGPRTRERGVSDVSASIVSSVSMNPAVAGVHEQRRGFIAARARALTM
jgi:hypothetical protein